jgi:hypothetical protein
MTKPPTMTTQDTLFEDLVRQHGGAEALSSAQLTVVAALVKALLDLQGAPAIDLPRLSLAIARFTAQLPVPREAQPPSSTGPGPVERIRARLDEIRRRGEQLEGSRLVMAEDAVARLTSEVSALRHLNALLEKKLTTELLS